MNILITGTSEGLGRELALRYLKCGHKVTGLSRRDASIKNKNYRHIVYDLNDSMAGFPKPLIAASYDLVILNAVHTDFTRFVGQSVKEVEQMVRVNTLAPMLLTQALLQKGAKKTLFVYIGSESCLNPVRGLAVYSATKMAMTTFAKVLSMEFRDTSSAFVNLVLGPIAIPAYVKDYRAKAKAEKKTLKQYLRDKIPARFPTHSRAELIDADTIGRYLDFLKDNQRHISGSSVRLDHGVVPSPV